MRTSQSQSDYIVELAAELLDDIELSRLPAETLLLKASRLARLAGSDEVQKWLGYERGGYISTDSLSLKYVGLTGRWINREKGLAYWGPLAAQESSIATYRAQLNALRVPDVSLSSANPSLYQNIGLNAQNAINGVLIKIQNTTEVLNQMSRVRSRVLALLHEFVTQVYHEKVFSNITESIFEDYKSHVDGLLAERCGDVLEKVPAIYDRLAAGDPEAVSQALATCRRVIDSFADAIYPPRAGTVELGGNQVNVSSQHHLNRINVYIAERTGSKSRRARFRQSLNNLYDRVNSGVHSDVTLEEARALLLETYVLIGEILTLAEPPPVPKEEPLSNEVPDAAPE